jgi:surface antigen
MAQVFPLNPDPSDGGRAALTRTLAALPDDWTLLCARQLGDEPSCTVDAVLIHPEIGLALIDLAPGEPGTAVAALREQLEHEGFAQYFPGELPIVALSIPAAAVDEAGERLADAFDAAPRLSITDVDWADAVIELLLVPNDMAMAGPEEAAAPAAAASEEMVEEDEEAEAAFAAESMVRSAPASTGRPKASAFAAAEEEPEPPWRLVADEPATAFYDRRSRHGRWAAVAAAVVLALGLGAGAWQLAEESGPGQAPEAAATPEVQVPIAQAPNAGASADPAQPAPPPSPPVRLAAKNFAKAPPPPPTPTRIDPLPQPKPPVQMAAKRLAEVPPPPPARTQVEPLPQPTPPAPAAVANAPTPARSPNAAAPRPAESQVAAGPQPPRQKPHRAAQQDETPVRQLMERQIERPPAATAPESRAPVREARAHPPIDAGDLPPLEEGASAPPSRETAAAPAPGPAAATSPVGPPIRLLGPPGAPAPASGNTVPATPAATAGANGSNPRECRPYTADTTLSGGRAPVQGIACRGADGQWRLVSEVPSR